MNRRLRKKLGRMLARDMEREHSDSAQLISSPSFSEPQFSIQEGEHLDDSGLQPLNFGIVEPAVHVSDEIIIPEDDFERADLRVLEHPAVLRMTEESLSLNMSEHPLKHLDIDMKQIAEAEGAHPLGFLKNSATRFCGERRIVALYEALRGADERHDLLRCGFVRNGQFRFTSDSKVLVDKNIKLVDGIPLQAEQGLKYAELLSHALL